MNHVQQKFANDGNKIILVNLRNSLNEYEKSANLDPEGFGKYGSQTIEMLEALQHQATVLNADKETARIQKLLRQARENHL